MKNKTTVGIFAITLGGIGAHKFYLGKTTQGILCILFCWTLIPSLIGIIEGITYLLMSDDKFNTKYNPAYFIQNQNAKPITKKIIKHKPVYFENGESVFNQEEKVKRRNWQSIDLIGTFILKDSTFKGQAEALKYFQKQDTFNQYMLNGESYYSVQFDLQKETPLTNLLNATTKVRKHTEVEIEGNYFNPTDLNLALWLFRSKSEDEYNQSLEIAKKSNKPDRIENAIEIKKYLETLTITQN